MTPTANFIARYGKIILLAVAVTFPVSAQNAQNEYQFWPSVAAGKTFQYGIRLELEQQLRLYDHQPYFSETFTELRIGGDISGNITITGYYRYILYSEDTAQRIALSFTTKSISGRTAGSFRVKIQRQQREGLKPVSHLRFRAKITLPTPNTNLQIYLQAEPWLLLGSVLDWTRYRADIGAEYRFWQRYSAALFYRYQGDGRGEYWTGTNILGLRLGIAF